MMFTLWEMKADAGCTTAKSNPKKQTSFTDATHHSEDLKKISMLVLVRYSEDDQIVPYQAAGRPSAKLLKNGH